LFPFDKQCPRNTVHSGDLSVSLADRPALDARRKAVIVPELVALKQWGKVRKDGDF